MGYEKAKNVNLNTQTERYFVIKIRTSLKIQKIVSSIEEILAWNPIMTNIGKIISKTIVGYNKNPGTPNPSIQLIVPSILKILLYADSKNNAEINNLPKRSNKFVM